MKDSIVFGHNSSLDVSRELQAKGMPKLLEAIQRNIDEIQFRAGIGQELSLSSRLSN